MANLPNPYEQQSPEPCEEEPSLAVNQTITNEYDNFQVDSKRFNYDYDDILSQPSPTFKYFREDRDVDNDARSETVRQRPIKNLISGIHEKYLQSQHLSHEKESFRSERKARTEKPFSMKFKKNTINELQNKKLVDLNPITQGLLALQIDSQKLKEEIDLKSQDGEEQKASLFSKMGLKQPKVLGKSKTERELQILRLFLQSGEMPPEYIQDFLLLISS